MNNKKESEFINENKKLILLCPQSLCNQYKTKEKTKKNLKKIIEKLKILQQCFQADNFEKEIDNVLILVESNAMVEKDSQISIIELLYSEGKVKYPKQEEIEEFNNYFDIQHVLTEYPEYILFSSAVIGYVIFWELTKNIVYKSTTDKLDTLVNLEFKPLLIWKRSHWIFLIFIQGLIICLLRFEKALGINNLNQIEIELKTASNLMIGAGAAMKLAGSYSRKEYKEQIFPTMKPPNLNIEGFSGLMSWDHAYLVTLWKQNTKNFRNLPLSLQCQYDEFLLAYKIMASSHRHICSKFGGGEAGGSVKHPTESGLLALEKIVKARWQMINPTQKSVHECLEMNNDPTEVIQTGFKNHIQLLSRAFNL